MQGRNRQISIFLSNPCTISNNIIETDSSWYRFVSRIGLVGDKVLIVAPDLVHSDSSFSIKLVNGVEFEKYEHFCYTSFKDYYQKAFKKPYYSMNTYYKIVKESDGVIFRIPTPGFSLVAFLAFLLRKPLVVFISGNIIEQSDTFSRSKGLARLFLSLFLKVRVKVHSILLKKASHLFCVSSEALNLYGLYESSNVAVVRTPVISNQEINSNQKPIEPKSKYKMIRACWLQESKGLENLIFAVKKISLKYDIALDIYGAAKDKIYGERIERLINDLGLSKIIFLKGWTSNDNLQKLFGNFDLHVMSSLAEGMPRVCLESAAKGLPQLVTPVGGIQDFFTHQHDAFICKDCSENSLVEGLEWFLKNRELALEMAKNAQDGVKANTIEVFSERFNRLIFESWDK